MLKRISVDVHLRQPVLAYLYEGLGAQMFANYVRLCVKAHIDARAASVASSIASAVSLSPSPPISSKKTVRVSFSERDITALNVIAAVPKEKRGLFLEASTISLAGTAVVSASYGFEPILVVSPVPYVASVPAVPYTSPKEVPETMLRDSCDSKPTKIKEEPSTPIPPKTPINKEAINNEEPAFEVSMATYEESPSEPSGEDILSMLEAMM